MRSFIGRGAGVRSRFFHVTGRHAGLLVAGCAVLLAGCAHRPAAPGSGAHPALTSTTPVDSGASLLGPRDFAGPGWRLQRVSPASTPPVWRWALTDCAAYDPADHPSQRQRVTVRQQTYRQRTGREATETVEWFAAGWGTRGMDDIRKVLETCFRYEHSGGGRADYLESHSIVAESFAGDDALLVETDRITPPASTVRFTGVVRRGDVIATVTGAGLPASEVRRLALIAASRLG